jgi:hypothetical protein
LNDVNDQKHAKRYADAGMKCDPAMQPSMSHALGVKLQPLLDTALETI